MSELSEMDKKILDSMLCMNPNEETIQFFKFSNVLSQLILLDDYDKDKSRGSSPAHLQYEWDKFIIKHIQEERYEQKYDYLSKWKPYAYKRYVKIHKGLSEESKKLGKKCKVIHNKEQGGIKVVLC